MFRNLFSKKRRRKSTGGVRSRKKVTTAGKRGLFSWLFGTPKKVAKPKSSCGG